MLGDELIDRKINPYYLQINDKIIDKRNLIRIFNLMKMLNYLFF